MKLPWSHTTPYTNLPERFHEKHRSNGCGLMPSPNRVAASLARRTRKRST